MALVPIDSTNFTVGTNAADPRVAAALAADPRSAVTDG